MQAVFLEIAINPVSNIFDGANKRCSIVFCSLSYLYIWVIFALLSGRMSLYLFDF